MATVDPLRYRTNGDDPEIDPRLLAQMQQVADTLTTEQRTRHGYTTPADSVYSVTARSRNPGIGRRHAQAMMRAALARHEAGLLPEEEGVVREDLLYPSLALLPAEMRQAEDDPSIFEFIQYYSPDMRRQLLAKLYGIGEPSAPPEGRASGGIVSLLHG